MMLIHFSNGCMRVDFGYASNSTMWILDEAEKILALHHIPLPDINPVEHLKISSKYGWNGWGEFINENLSLILNPNDPSQRPICCWLVNESNTHHL